MKTTKMITIQDLYNIVGNKMANEAGKAFIRKNFPPQIAEHRLLYRKLLFYSVIGI